MHIPYTNRQPDAVIRATTPAQRNFATPADTTTPKLIASAGLSLSVIGAGLAWTTPFARTGIGFAAAGVLAIAGAMALSD